FPTRRSSDLDPKSTENPASPVADQGARPRRPGGARKSVLSKGRLAAIGLAVLTVAAVVVTGFLGYRYAEGRSVEEARESSLAAARDYARSEERRVGKECRARW